jgi:hypothetical protein
MMSTIQVVAIPTEVANAVRTTMRAPAYGSPRTRNSRPTTRLAGTACELSWLAWTGEFYSLTIGSRASNRCPNQAQFISTLIIVRGTPAMADFWKSFEQVRERWKPTPGDGDWLRKRMWPTGASSQRLNNYSASQKSTTFK